MLLPENPNEDQTKGQAGARGEETGARKRPRVVTGGAEEANWVPKLTLHQAGTAQVGKSNSTFYDRWGAGFFV